VCLFVLNGVITLFTINSNKKLATDIFKVIAPSIQGLDDFKKIMLESEMYTTNWVFLRSNKEDKKLLEKLHDSDYAALKSRITVYSSQWADKNWVDSLNRIYTGFEELLVIEKNIMGSLKEFKDYDDPVIKLEAERKVEEEIIPRTTALMNSLKAIHAFGISTRAEKGTKLERSSMKLRMLIIALTITIILTGFLLSMYMTKLIIGPVNRLRHIINGLGLGIIQKIDHYSNKNEIGRMIHSVNKLSEKLQATAAFAYETGLRNYDTPFKPLSEQDTLSKALIAMRDNIKLSDEKLNQAQQIARLGSWERNIKSGKLTLSDEIFSIFDIDPLSFDFQFQSIMKLIHPDDLEYAMGLSRKNLYKVPVAYECRIVTSKGIIKNIWVETKVVPGKHGEIEKTFGTVQDITERKRVEEQIKLSNERYELVTKTTNDMIWDWDLVNNTIFRNENYCKLFGEDGSDRHDIGKWMTLVHPEDKEWVSDFIRQKLDDPEAESWEAEFRCYRYNGEMAYLYDRGYIIRDENKKAIRMVGATCDITERKKAEIQLYKSEERYRQIVETAQEGIWMIDENNYTILVNKKMAALLEYSPEEMMGKQNYYFMDDEWKKKASAHIVNRKLGMEENHDFKYITKSGKDVWTNLSTNPVFDDAGIYKGALAMVTDITERKLDEELLRQSEINLGIKNKELERKNRELEQFAYVASHDLQEPLRTTTAFVELLQKQYKGKMDEKADKYLNYIVQASDRMNVLINDLLDYSRIGSKMESKRVDCNKLLDEVLGDLNVAITEAGVEIKTGELPVINGYPTEMKQLFQNLIINSIKFRQKNISPLITMCAWKKPDSWQFAFSDNGIGIAKEHNERIFTIFQRLHTRNEYKGSGIGLSHCKKIVELHKGKIWLESEVGNGTTFYFTIPHNNN
jgi:PAS domain S-box-containing protein